MFGWRINGPDLTHWASAAHWRRPIQHWPAGGHGDNVRKSARRVEGGVWGGTGWKGGVVVNRELEGRADGTTGTLGPRAVRHRRLLDGLIDGTQHVWFFGEAYGEARRGDGGRGESRYEGWVQK